MAEALTKTQVIDAVVNWYIVPRLMQNDWMDSVFKFFKTQKRQQSDAEQPRRSKERSYKAVSIQPGERPCACAVSLESKRFLSSDAPRLPLGACTRATCTCRYRHHEDRRREPRRYSDRAHFPRHYAGPERRDRGRGRRAEDLIFQ